MRTCDTVHMYRICNNGPGTSNVGATADVGSTSYFLSLQVGYKWVQIVSIIML